MITELEAEEYLNPAALGAGAGALQQPNIQARNVVRAGIVAHGDRCSACCCCSSASSTSRRSARRRDAGDVDAQEPQRGYVRVDAQPWARVYVDGKLVGVTPLAQAARARPRASTRSRFEHDWYQPVERTIEVVAGTAKRRDAVSVDFEKLKARCKPGKDREP